VGPHYVSCFKSPTWRLEISGGYWISGRVLRPCVTPSVYDTIYKDLVSEVNISMSNNDQNILHPELSQLSSVSELRVGYDGRNYSVYLFVQLPTAGLGLIVRSWLDVPTLATRRHHARAPSGERWNCGREMSGNFAEMTISTPFRDLLHAVKLRYATDSFTSPPNEGVLRILFALKIRRIWPGVNPRTWVPKASTLTLDHQSRLLRVCQVTRSLCLLQQ
jgi:hypothetical protein